MTHNFHEEITSEATFEERLDTLWINHDGPAISWIIVAGDLMRDMLARIKELEGER